MSNPRRNLDLTRGRPATEFLDLAAGLEIALPQDLALEGRDLRNYGGFPGLPSARQLGAELLRAPVDNLLVGGNSSLSLLGWTVATLWFRGFGHRPWSERDRTACLCPVPGYDRHFAMFDLFGIGTPTVPMTGQGADMDAVEQALEDDPSIAAIVLVPRHSNPSGDVWSAEALERLMQLAARAPDDFAILCDNAYAVHDFAPTAEQPDLWQLAERHGVLDKLYLFGSTSKLGYAGSGLGFGAFSEANLAQMLKTLASLSPGADMLAQGRHVLYFREQGGLMGHIARLAPLWRHRFETAQRALDPLREVPGVQIGRPTGGYFICVDLPDGTARRAVELAAEAGVRLSPAGSTFPGGIDPNDRNLRLAPTSPPLEDLADAMTVFGESAIRAIEEQGAG